MLKVYLDASTKGNPGPSGGGLLIVGEDLHEQHAFVLPQGAKLPFVPKGEVFRMK